MKKITDKNILDLVKKYSEGDEGAGDLLLLGLVHVLLDIRNTVKPKKQNLVTDPTKAKRGDIVIGEFNSEEILTDKLFDEIPEQEIFKGGKL